MHYHQCQRACHELEHAARHVYRGAERNRESGHRLAHAKFDRLPERDGYRGSRRLCAECGEVGRHHSPEQFQRILAMSREHCRDTVLENQQEDVERENHHDYLHECRQDRAYLTADGHRQEYAEDIERQQRHDRPVDHLDHDIAKVAEHVAQRSRATCERGRSESEHKRYDQRRVHGHERRHLYSEECGRSLCSGCPCRGDILHGLDHRREESHSGEVAEKSGEKRGHISQNSRKQQHLACTRTDIGDCRCHKSENDQRYAEPEELAEYRVECREATREPKREKHAAADAAADSDEDTDQEARTPSLFLRGLCHGKSIVR